MQAIEAGNDPQGWLDQLEGSSLALAMRGELWLYPLVEVVHIIGFSLLVGAVVMFDLRVLGVSKDIAVTALARHLLPWALAALLLIVPAGNGVFILKLCLIAAAGLNALAFHLGIYRTVSQWNTASAAPGLAKAQAVLSVAIWFTVVLCGRLLAYT